MKKVTIEIPDDCEVKIVKKEEKKEEKKERIIRTYQDLIDNRIKIKGVYVNSIGQIISHNGTSDDININIAYSEKVAKSMLAMAMISQLIPYYGGAITDEEWTKHDMDKYFIYRYVGRAATSVSNYQYHYLAFHTKEQRDEFLKYNEQLVKDYLMID